MSNWEQETIQKILLENLKEQRSSRRWKIFFRLIILGLIIWAVLANTDQSNGLISSQDGPQVAVVDFKGTIDSASDNVGLVIKGLNAALKDKKTVAVIIQANSPGGSPVYSDNLNTEITRLRKLYPSKPIYFVVKEVCASGCYYAAAAATKIYASPASIVGSIGVIYTGFGATEAIKKIGVDSRLLISGRNKAMGYPFAPESHEQSIMQQQMLDEIHQQFIAAVKNGRGAKLVNDPDLFSGRYWIGADAQKLGLIDGFGTVSEIARDQFKTENLVDFTPDKDPFVKITRRLGMSIADSFTQSINSSFTGTFN